MKTKDPETKRKEKQNFLKQVILDPNYDKDDFTIFIDRKRSNAGDIDKWNVFELEKIVDEYKRQPNTFFSRQKFDDKKSVYTALEITCQESNIIEIKIKELGKIIHRTLSDIEWISKVYAQECPYLHFPKLNYNQLSISGKLVSNASYILKYHLEFLFVFYFGLSSSSLKSFFTYSEEEFALFRSVLSKDVQTFFDFYWLFVFRNDSQILWELTKKTRHQLCGFWTQWGISREYRNLLKILPKVLSKSGSFVEKNELKRQIYGRNLREIREH